MLSLDSSIIESTRKVTCNVGIVLHETLSLSHVELANIITEYKDIAREENKKPEIEMVFGQYVCEQDE